MKLHQAFVVLSQILWGAAKRYCCCHSAAGSVKTVTTKEDGAYRLKGLRVGGPYRIFVDSDNCRDETVTMCICS